MENFANWFGERVGQRAAKVHKQYINADQWCYGFEAVNFSLLGAESAVRGDVRARHEARLLGEQEEGDVGDVLE